MANVSKKWIGENVEKMSAVGGQITLDNLSEYCNVPKGGFETTLTKLGIEEVEAQARAKKFHILLPGHGWAECWGKSELDDDDGSDLL